MTTPGQTLVITKEEQQILLLAAQGLTDTVAGRRIGTSARTYRRRLVDVSAKLGARNRAHAAAIAVALGLVAAADLRPRRPIQHAETPLRSPAARGTHLKSGFSARSNRAGGTP